MWFARHRRQQRQGPRVRKLDFDKRPVWRILVGGTKLSRGFTVEGLTVSYYRRADGGPRPHADGPLVRVPWGYKDLVRLYIGRNEQDRNMRLDLYEAFGAMVRDEEDFRGNWSGIHTLWTASPR